CADMGRESAEAAWILTHLPNTDNNAIDEYRLQLTETAMSTMNVSLRRLTLALLERLQWNEQDIRSDFLDFCFERMLNNDETYGVRALCIKIAYAQCRHYVELREELRISLSLIEPETIGSGLKHCRNKTLQQL
ncbi:MAG: hypothetical protein IK032_06910, partial [Bacteroidales bacterium]|nr:hypothetical protein [Bacteroidales bacterium]